MSLYMCPDNIKLRRPPAPWLTDEILQLVNDINAKRRNLKQDRLNSNLQQDYKALMKQVKTMMSATRKAYYNKELNMHVKTQHSSSLETHKRNSFQYKKKTNNGNNNQSVKGSLRQGARCVAYPTSSNPWIPRRKSPCRPLSHPK